MASSAKVLIPIFLLVSILCTVSVIYGALEMSDGERSALEVLQDLINGKLSLKDIWNALTGEDDKPDDKPDDKAEGTCAGPDTNGVYEFDVDGNCVKLSCKPGYFEQGGICMQQRDLSDEFYGGTIPIDCEISGYTFSDCMPKVNRKCGEGAGTRQKYPTVLDGFAARAGGECEPITEVDCDIECPTECSVLRDHYSSVANAACYGIKTDNTIVELSTETGFCGSGEESLTFIPENISLQDAQDANFATVQEYLEYANPNGVCEQIKPTSPTACTVDCDQLNDSMEPMVNVGCNYARTEYAYIRDESGPAICFNTESVKKYLNPTIGEVSTKPTKLATIEASSVRGTDGSYDMSSVPEDKKKGVHLLYRASNNLSFDDLVKSKCHLYDTEPCDAPLEDVDCVMGLSTPRNELACTYNGCGQKRYKTLTYVAKTQPFGGGELCPTEDSNYEFTRIEEQGCSTESRCCEDSDYVTGECNNEGINRYTLDTTYCDNSDTQIPVSKDVDCDVNCVQSGWTNSGGCNGSTGKQSQTRTTTTAALNDGTACGDTTQDISCTPTGFDNERFYIKDGYGNYLGQYTTNNWMGVGSVSAKTYFTLDGSFTNVTIKGGINDKYCAQMICTNDSPENVVYSHVSSMASKGYWTFERQSDGGYRIRPKMNDGGAKSLYSQEGGYYGVSLGVNTWGAKTIFYLEKA